MNFILHLVDILGEAAVILAFVAFVISMDQGGPA